LTAIEHGATGASDFHKDSPESADYDLSGMFTAFVRQYGLAAGGIERGYRRVDSESHVNTVAYCDKPAQQMRRSALERILLSVPFLDLAFPQDDSVEGVPRDKPPLGRQLHRGRGTFVENVEEPPRG
jgi:hypothetical protein